MSSKLSTVERLLFTVSFFDAYGDVIVLCVAINETSQWKSLEEHQKTIDGVHLRAMLADEDRCASCVCEFDDIILDYSRSWSALVMSFFICRLT
jgi:hypothetical protein